MNNDDYKTYLFTYRYDNADWGFEIKAKNPQEAKERVSKLIYARLDGELVAKIPAELGLLTRIFVRLRNSIQALLPAQ